MRILLPLTASFRLNQNLGEADVLLRSCRARLIRKQFRGCNRADQSGDQIAQNSKHTRAVIQQGRVAGITEQYIAMANAVLA